MKQVLPIYLFFFFLILGKGSMCGGNCPSGNCHSCKSGLSPNYIDLDKYCRLQPFSLACCKCIISKTSASNSRFLKYFNGEYYSGVLPIKQMETITLCHGSFLSSYDYHENAKCAYQIYSRDGSWKYWNKEAQDCGCSSILQMVKVIDPQRYKYLDFDMTKDFGIK